METKLQQLRDFWATGDYRRALKLAASWPRLGLHKEAIQRGWAALSYPSFYVGLGVEPASLVGAGLDALAERYGFSRAAVWWCSRCGEFYQLDVSCPCT